MKILERGPIRRLLASVMLAALVVLDATPLLVGGAAAFGCPLAPTPGSRVPVLVAGMDAATCEHTDAAPCVAAIGCVTAAPALRPVAVALVIPGSLIGPGSLVASQFRDLYRTGPPTPPPNLI